MRDISEDWAEWIESLSQERIELINIRLNRAVEDWDDEEEITEKFTEITKLMYVQDKLDGLKEDGLVEVVRIDEDGNAIYKATPEGRKLIESLWGLGL